MPIKIPNDLPAVKTLNDENIFVMTETRAITQDIRPLKILLLNLMPKKIETETQISRLLGNSPLQVDLEFLHTKSHISKNTSAEHLFTFYKTFEDVRDRTFDGMIITGAPVEKLPFEEVEYWEEISKIFAWADTHVTSTMYICWAAQAGLFYHYGIPKYHLSKKMFGIFKQYTLQPQIPLFRGFDDNFSMPHSRHTEVRREDIDKHKELEIVAESPESGVSIVMARGGRQIFVTGHMEYSPYTLDSEYRRDLGKRDDVEMPKNYYKDNDPHQAPLVTWRAHANLMFSNWINYYIYQETPYNIEDIE